MQRAKVAAPEPETERARERQGVQSVEVGGRILAVMATMSGPGTLKDIAQGAGMSASKVHRYLVSLAKCGLVRQDRTSSRYDLGETALRLGLAALTRQNVVQLATEAIVELNRRRDLTTLLSVWSERGPVVVGWYDSSELVVCNVHVGSVFPLLRTATGRVFLAFQPKQAIEAMVRRELGGLVSHLPNHRVRTQTDVDDLIQEVRRTRLGKTREEFLPGLDAVAAPLFDHQGRIAAAIAFIDLAGGSAKTGAGSHAAALLDVAADLSRKLGFVDHGPGSSFAERCEG